MSSEIERYLYYPEMSPRRPIQLDVLVILAVILVGVSIIGVSVASMFSPAPLYRTRDLVGNFFLNYATVMIEGRVIEPVRLDVQTGGRIRLTITLKEEVEDATPFTIFVYDPVASAYLNSPNYADFGDYIRILIQVRVREEFTYGILQSPNHVTVIEKISFGEPVYTTSLRGIEEFTYVCARGLISNPRNVSAGLLFDIATVSDSVTVLVPNTFRYKYRDHERFPSVWEGLNNAGTMVTLCGPVYYYRRVSPEIVLTRIEDVRLEALEGARDVSFVELSQYIGDIVTVSGIFTSLGYDSGTRLYQIRLVDEHGNSIIATAPREIINRTIDPWRIGTGSRIRVVGTVKSATEITASQLTILETRPPLNTTRVADALAQPHGTIVVLWGAKVESSQTTSGGNWIVDVADDTGTIRIFVPSAVARGIGATPPSPGKYIAVAGYRTVYRQYEEIVVYSERGLIEVAPPSTMPAQPGIQTVRIADLGAFINKEVSIEAELIAIRYSSGERIYYVEVRDNTGSANATMTRDLVSLIDPWRAGPGTRLRIIGTVSSSNLMRAKSLEIITAINTPIMTIAEALKKPYGSIVAVENARVVSSRETSGRSWQITITDDSGAQILVFIPASVVADIGRPLPSPGSIISVAGYRDVYQGTEEIIVYARTGYRA